MVSISRSSTNRDIEASSFNYFLHISPRDHKGGRKKEGKKAVAGFLIICLYFYFKKLLGINNFLSDIAVIGRKMLSTGRG